MAKVKYLARKSIGFIGAGNMAEAIAGCLVNEESISAGNIHFSDPSAERCEVFSAMGTVKASDNIDLCNKSDVIILAVKPQIAKDVIAGFSAEISGEKLFISIMMGIATEEIENMLPDGMRVVRAMPNTPIRVGEGVTAVCRGNSSVDDDVSVAIELFSLGGYAAEVAEEMMHAVTALSGSGPAYIFRFTENLAEAGEKLGMPRDISYEFAKKTVIGAARLLEKSEDSAKILREKVTSPGGTTEAALKSFAESGFDKIVLKALRAAFERSQT